MLSASSSSTLGKGSQAHVSMGFLAESGHSFGLSEGEAFSSTPGARKASPAVSCILMDIGLQITFCSGGSS